MNECLFGDCRKSLVFMLDAGIDVQMCVTSPPYYGLRDYGRDGQLGLETTPEEYIKNMVDVFRAVRDVLSDDGVLWLNVGDSYAMSTKGSSGKGVKQLSNAGTLLPDRSSKIPAGMKPKDLIGIPWMLAFALRADGWYLRQDIIWHKPNPMPEPVRDRCTKSHEYLFLLSKSQTYYFDADAIKESAVDGGMRNKRSVWTVPPKPCKGAHFAVYPPDLITPCVLAGSRHGDVILDPFFGSGTTGQVAIEHGRRFIGCELNDDYKSIQDARISRAMISTHSE